MKEIVFGDLDFPIANSYKAMKPCDGEDIRLFGKFAAKLMVYKRFFGAETSFEFESRDASLISEIDEILTEKYGEPDYIAHGEMKIWREKDFYIAHGMEEMHYQVDVHVVKVSFCRPYFYMVDYEKYREHAAVFDKISEKWGLCWSGNLVALDRQMSVLADTGKYSYFFYFGRGKFTFYSSEKVKVAEGTRFVPSWNRKGKYKTAEELYIQLDSFFSYLKEYDTSLKGE